MIIETLILSALSMTLGAIIGYVYGSEKRCKDIFLNWNGWKVAAFEGTDGRFYLGGRRENQDAILVLRADGDLDFIYDKDKRDVK